nr:MAG TPA: anaerobic ribonucleoside triphosphate reductase [Caudoviricetes sp.]
MFGDFVFPDFSKPVWTSVAKLQNFFLKWFNQERTKAVLTFPVVTAAMLTDGGKCKDTVFADVMAKELAEGNSFFVYLSDNPDSLASCCRLRNAIEDRTFSYTLGAGGVATGSINVITINMNRLVQDGRDLLTEVEKIHRYQYAYRKLMEEYLEAGMLTVYDAGFITLDKQYLTIGINGMAEAAESQGITVGNNSAYLAFVQEKLKTIYHANQRASAHYGVRYNTEFVPAENLGVKNAAWDKRDGYRVPRDCYNSYFYRVEDDDLTILDKIEMYGKDITEHLDGGSALHLNLEQLLTFTQAKKIFELCRKNGVPYWTTNTRCTICNTCGNIDPETRQDCKQCGSKDIDYGTRIIGYLRRISSFSDERQKEAARRYYT